MPYPVHVMHSVQVNPAIVNDFSFTKLLVLVNLHIYICIYHFENKHVANATK